MKQSIDQVALMVEDYDQAIGFYCNILGFRLTEHKNDGVAEGSGRRRFTLAPNGSTESKLLLVKARSDSEASRIGNQARFHSSVFGGVNFKLTGPEPVLL